MAVVAKFTCTSNAKNTNWTDKDVNDVTFSAVYDSNPESENGKFFAATPAGSISLSSANADATVELITGKNYKVTFELDED